MTVFIGNLSALGEKGGNNFPISPNDERITLIYWYSKGRFHIQSDHLWPRSYLRAQAGIGDWLANAPPIWDWFLYTASGGFGGARYTVSGVTRDATGTVLGNCFVTLIETATDNVMDPGVTSDAITGAYVCTSPSQTACYAVAYKTGSPDVFGTTLNTLIPAG